jgi:hypothetical protein
MEIFKIHPVLIFKVIFNGYGDIDYQIYIFVWLSKFITINIYYNY